MTIFFIIYLAVVLFLVSSFWKMFTKAGQPGWACIIPIYNMLVYLKVINRPWWWLILLFIPLVGIVIGIICNIDLAKAFGKSTLFGVLIIFFSFICIPIIAFGSSVYTRPVRAA